MHGFLAPDDGSLRFGRFEFWPQSRRLLRDGRACAIGGRAFDLLMFLLVHRHRVVGVSEIMRAVWPGLRVEPNNVQVQVWTLRRLLGKEVIVTVPRRGYRFVAGPMDAQDIVFRSAQLPRTAPHEPIEQGRSDAVSGHRARLRWIARRS